MAIDTRRVRRALRAAGVHGSALLGATWPFARGARLRALLRRRLAVLEAKNAIAGFVFRLQRPLAEHRLSSVEHVRRLLADPQQRGLLLGLLPSRSVIADELSRTPGIETGPTLDAALSELVREGCLLRIPGEEVLSAEEVFLAAPAGRPGHWDTTELNRLVRESVGQATELRRRERRRSTTDGSRSYDL